MQPQGPPSGPYSPPGQPYPPQGPQPLPGQPQYPAGYPYTAAQPYQQQIPGPVQPGQNVMPQPQQPSGQVIAPQYEVPKNIPKTPNDPSIPPPPEAATTPYDFFMQPKPAQAATPLPVTGRKLGNIPTDYNRVGSNINTDGLKGKFPLIVGGGLALILILFLVTALTPKDQTGPQLFSIAQTQQEIVRVCAQGATRAKYRSTRFFATTCSLSIASNQKDLTSYMTKVNIKVDPKQLGAKADKTTDSKLAAAQSSSTYDATLRELVGAELDNYDKALIAQLGVTTGANAREVLSKAQASNELLIKMVQDTSDKTEAPADSGSAL